MIIMWKKMKGILEEDRCYTCEELAESIGIIHGPAHSILIKHLKR